MNMRKPIKESEREESMKYEHEEKELEKMNMRKALNMKTRKRIGENEHEEKHEIQT